MRIKYCVATLAALLIMQPVFADDNMGGDNKPCKPIAKSCMDAGFKRRGDEGKRFWQDCMQPILMGKTVSGVTVDEKDVKACRDAKISDKQQQINTLKSVQ